jgi:hypothetical protein
MQEQRRSARTHVFKAAQLLMLGRGNVAGCTVRDLSAGGACIEIARVTEVPRFFELSFDWFRSYRRCEVRWRSETRIGVAFS